MKEKPTKRGTVDIIISVCAFVFVQYLLACFNLSFRGHIFGALILACNTSTIVWLWGELSKGIESKPAKCAIVGAGILAVGALLLTVGYFPISTALQKLL